MCRLLYGMPLRVSRKKNLSRRISQCLDDTAVRCTFLFFLFFFRKSHPQCHAVTFVTLNTGREVWLTSFLILLLQGFFILSHFFKVQRIIFPDGLGEGLAALCERGYRWTQGKSENLLYIRILSLQHINPPLKCIFSWLAGDVYKKGIINVTGDFAPWK